MFKLNLKDKITLIGVLVLVFGIGLMIFTFVNAYGFLAQDLSILTSSDLSQTFGDALAPLISTCIRIMYLGVMGWIGSLLTIRGITLLTQPHQTVSVSGQEKAVSKETDNKVKDEIKPLPAVKKTEKVESETNKPEPQQTQPVMQPTEVEVKPESRSESKPYEPEIVMLPPKTVEKTIQEKPQTETEQK